jgi:hypothetical protein
MPTHQKGGTGVLIRKACILVLSIVMMVVAGRSFATHLREKEPIVAGPGVSKVANLSDYFSPLKGTPGDTPVYIMDEHIVEEG